MGDAGPCAAQNGDACVMCCRGTVSMDENGALDNAVKLCACQPGRCGMTNCSAFCMNAGTPTTDMSCPPMCLDPTTFDAGCPALRDCYEQKNTTGNCKELAFCIAGCKPP